MYSAITVSLFTREGIEIAFRVVIRPRFTVSLFTREWIEIYSYYTTIVVGRSPSLRGSGLKYLMNLNGFRFTCVSLFTREWIEIALYEELHERRVVSLFTREWIEIGYNCTGCIDTQVSLFTREWIEIDCSTLRSVPADSLPLYEGVD